MELLRKNFALTELKVSDETPGVFEAIVSVFGNVDQIGDRVVKGAFARTLKERGLPPIYHSHQWQDGPIGQSLEAEERDAGLWIKGQLFIDLNDSYVSRIYAGMKSGGLREFSFAFSTKESRWVEEDGTEIRELTDLDLYEVGPTLVGMNPETELIRVASALRGEESPAAIVALEAALKHGLAPKYIQEAHDALVKAGCKCAIDDSHEEEEEAGKSDPGDDAVAIQRRERLIDIYSIRPTREAVA